MNTKVLFYKVVEKLWSGDYISRYEGGVTQMLPRPGPTITTGQWKMNTQVFIL